MISLKNPPMLDLLALGDFFAKFPDVWGFAALCSVSKVLISTGQLDLHQRQPVVVGLAGLLDVSAGSQSAIIRWALVIS